MSEQKNLECMLDLETAGTSNTAAPLSIGACHFDPNTNELDTLGAFEVIVDLQSCVDIGMTFDVSTFLWWMGKEVKDDAERMTMDAARRVMAENQKHAIPIHQALHRFSAWLGANKPVWGNGATFDNVILRNAYRLAGIPCPWAFWNDRCYRTAKCSPQATGIKLVRQGTYHAAMWDAISQAAHLQAINSHIRNTSLTTTGA